MSLNTTIVQLRTGKDAELKSKNDKEYATTSGAYKEEWKDKSGEKHSKTTWYNLIVWGPLAKNFAKYVTKGKEIIVEGKMESNEYTDEGGNKKTSWVLRVNSFHFTSGSPKTSSNDEPDPETPHDQKLSSSSDIDSDIPF